MIMMAMCIVAVLGNGIPQLVAAIMFASMPTMARNNRATILRVRGSDYIESSEAIGVSQIQMILKHMIPNAAGIMIIYFVGFLAVSIMMHVLYELHRRRSYSADSGMGTDPERRKSILDISAIYDVVPGIDDHDHMFCIQPDGRRLT